ncbi:hypothetical protein SMICM17S_09717 [Streptomyces microflavus]
MPSMPRWMRTSSAGIQLMSVVACIVAGWSWSKPAVRTIAAMRTAPVTVTPWRSTAWSGFFPLSPGGAGSRATAPRSGTTTMNARKESTTDGLISITVTTPR